MLLTRLLVLTCLVTTTLTIQCPPNWTGFRRHCYRFLQKNVAFETAIARCKRYASCDGTRGSLVAIENKAENEFLAEWILSLKNKERRDVLLGLKHDGVDFKWVNGKGLYSRFKMNEPSDGKCVVMSVDNVDGYVNDYEVWYAVDCNRQFHAMVCEIKAC